MPSLQTAQHEGHADPRTAAAPSGQRFLQAPGEVVWRRRDWAEPVGALLEISASAHDTVVGGRVLQWTAFRIETLWLGRKASLLLLQGMRLNELLIPNHQLEHSSFDEPFPTGHLLLRVDPWKYWLPQPKLTGLVIAQLGEIPAGVSAPEVFSALALDSAA